ncbi:MAG: P-loop NTPase [Planctomycetia bacterium]|nr:P-loop NTPase [Planctomycetia bacterium]
MRDQADALRDLVRAAHDAERAAAPRRLIVVCGGKGGVGTTTLSVHLAAALARLGRSCVLVDADLNRADATALCGLTPRRGVEAILAGEVNAEELLMPHAAGMRVLGAAWAPHEPTQITNNTARRLVAALSQLASTQWVLVDAGSSRSALHSTLWQEASQVIVVTTPDDLAVMDTYARIKSQTAATESTPVGVVVNRVRRPSTAGDVQARLEQVCWRFLGRTIEGFGQAPESAGLSGMAATLLPAGESDLARAMRAVAQRIVRSGEPRESISSSARSSDAAMMARADGASCDREDFAKSSAAGLWTAECR